VGQTVCQVGRVSGTRCGTVTALNQAINYPGGIVYGLIRTNICSEAGDTGAPLYANDVLVAHSVGASGNCLVGGTTWHQPVS
ncbi:S1 family peptidase, partial [Streptomyces calidiresistens]|uniref:S1 family peptidase n=1 Tax=Streptomyces calidiresistens TaxID=1485586 RepID=UPI001E53C8E8